MLMELVRVGDVTFTACWLGLSWISREGTKDNIILNSVRQYNYVITQDNYKATCFDYRLVILRPILAIVSQDAMYTLGSHRVYIHGIHQIKSFVSKGATCRLCLQEWDT